MVEVVDIFNEAHLFWQRLSSERDWYQVLADLYTARFPQAGKEVGEASEVAHSILESDDSVHAFDARGVRGTIIQRIIEGEKRGHIRPWYTDAGLWAEGSNVLKAVPEEDIHYVTSLSMAYPEGHPAGPHTPLINTLFKTLDPAVPINDDGTRNELEYVKMQEELYKYLRPQIELFGVVNGLERLLFPLSEEHFGAVVDLLFDPEQADKVLRRRFYNPKDPATRTYPLVGEGHPDLGTQANFLLRYLALDDEEIYKRRLVQVWLFTLMRSFPSAKDYLAERGAAIIDDIDNWCRQNNKSYKDLLWMALNLVKFQKVFLNLSHRLRSEYVLRAEYSVYSTELYHLLQMREEAVKPFEGTDFPAHVNVERYSEYNLLVELGQRMIQSMLEGLWRQIPKPQGMAHHQQAIMSKRKTNLERVVAPSHLRQELITEWVTIAEKYNGGSNEETIAMFRKITDVLRPRGESYFEELKGQVDAWREETGGMDLAEEIMDQADAPQSLVRQYAPEAQRFMRQFFDDPDKITLADFYGLVMSMKGVELLFDEAGLNQLRKNNVTRSLLEDYVEPQLEMLRKIHKHQQEVEAVAEEETVAPTEGSS